MKNTITQLDALPVGWKLVIAGAVVGLVYYAGRKVVTEAAGLVTGNNAITQNQTNAGGETVTAYQNAGILGTLGAVANSASGGILASAGESLGGWLFDKFGPKVP